MFTDGVGGLLELPNFSVRVRGLDDWNYSRMPERPVIPEPRLLAAVRSELSPGVRELRAAPWLEGQSEDPNGPAGQVGVPVIPFPAWFRCTRCNQLRQQDLQVLQELIEAGKVTAVIDRTFPLSQVPQAIRYLVEGHGGGKIVITVWPLCRVLPARSLFNCFHLILPWQQRAL
jgi:hypothetical protein